MKYIFSCLADIMLNLFSNTENKIFYLCWNELILTPKKKKIVQPSSFIWWVLYNVAS